MSSVCPELTAFASFLVHTLLFRLFLLEKSYLVVCGSPEVLFD